MTASNAWLPDQCLADPRLAGHVARVVTAWADHWLVGARLVVSGAWLATVVPDSRSAAFECSNGVSGYVENDALPLLFTAMLGARVGLDRPNRFDRKFMNSLTGHALQDLARRLDAVVMCPREKVTTTDLLQRGTPPIFTVSVADEAEAVVIQLKAERRFLVALSRSLARPARKPAQMTAPIAATQSVPVMIGARLGQVSLPLAEIHDLKIGDVIRIGTSVDADLGMTINGVVSGSARMMANRKGDRIILQRVGQPN